MSHRKWGARGDVFQRLLQPDYADGVSQPRSSRGTHALPDAELVIEQLQRHVESELRHDHITAMLPAWGQLLANDLYEVGQLPISGKCCQREANVKDPSELQQCFVRAGPDCKEYKRSAPGFDAEVCQKRKTNFTASLSTYIYIYSHSIDRRSRANEHCIGLHRWLGTVWFHPA